LEGFLGALNGGFSLAFAIIGRLSYFEELCNREER
jgi:hypothetical protein